MLAISHAAFFAINKKFLYFYVSMVISQFGRRTSKLFYPNEKSEKRVDSQKNLRSAEVFIVSKETSYRVTEIDAVFSDSHAPTVTELFVLRRT